MTRADTGASADDDESPAAMKLPAVISDDGPAAAADDSFTLVEWPAATVALLAVDEVKVPAVHKGSQISADEPFALTSDILVLVTDEEPDAVGEGSAVADEKLAAAEEIPAVANKGPAVAYEGPAVADEGSPVADNGATVASGGLAVADERLAVADEDPAVVDEGPAVVDKGPAVADATTPVADVGTAVAVSETQTADEAFDLTKDILVMTGDAGVTVSSDDSPRLADGTETAVGEAASAKETLTPVAAPLSDDKEGLAVVEGANGVEDIPMLGVTGDDVTGDPRDESLEIFRLRGPLLERKRDQVPCYANRAGCFSVLCLLKRTRFNWFSFYSHFLYFYSPPPLPLPHCIIKPK